MLSLASILMWLWIVIKSILIWVVSVVIVMGGGGLLWAACCRIGRLAELVVYLVRQPFAFRVMQAERDQARAAFEAATRISELRAEAARRMAEVTGVSTDE